MSPLAIVRPEPGASATAAAAARLGLDPLVIPLFAIQALAWELPALSRFDGLLLTSANAVRHGGSQLNRLSSVPAYCVGEATAEAAREAGLAVALAGSAGIDALLISIPAGVRLLHLCGEDHREPDAVDRSIEHVAVYSALELPVPDRLADLIGAVVAVHSPRAARRLSTVVDEAGLERDKIRIAAISTQAERAAGFGWKATAAAGHPSERALLALAARLCNNQQ